MRLIAIATLPMLLACGPEVAGSGTGADASTGDHGSSGAVVDGTGTTMADTSAAGTQASGTVGDDTSSTGAAEGSTGAPEPLCGNGVLDPDEGCDDGNHDDGDDCDSDCVPTEVIVWSVEQAGAGGQHDCAARVVATAQGVWVAGHMRDAEATPDAWFARIGDDGGWLWQSSYASSDDDEATGLAVDGDGNAFVGGTYSSSAEHVWIRRLDPQGVEVWSHTWADDLVGAEVGIDLALVDGVPWLVAQRYEQQPPLVLRYDGDGVLVAAVELPVDPGVSLYLADLRAGPAEAWLFGAHNTDRVASTRPTLVRLGADALPVQTIDVATPSSAVGIDGGVSGAVGPDGSLAIISYDAPAGGDTPTVRRYDPEGTLVAAWLVDLDGRPRVNDLAILDGGDLVLVGERHDVVWTRRVTGEGELVWERLHTPPDGYGSAEAVAIAPDGDVVVAGCVGLGGAADAWVTRYRG